jgi:hypothetical protein
MQTIYITEAEHFSIPGRPINAHATRALAVADAVELTNIMLKDNGQVADATTKTWEERIDKLQDEHGAAHCYVEIRELTVASDGAEPLNGQQLVARIKRSSKYAHQAPPGNWFDVHINRRYPVVSGNHNAYAMSDVVFGIRLDDGTVMELKA